MKRIIFNLAIAALAFGSTSLMAQSITVGSNSGLPGATVIIPINFATGPTAIGSFDVQISFTNTNFSAASANCAVAAVGQGGALCSGSLAGGVFQVSISGNGTDALTTGLAANLSFTIAGAATPGAKALDGVIISCGTPVGGDIDPCTITVNDGAVTVSAGPQPLYASTPAPGALNVGTVPQGGTDPSTNVVINNTGGAASSTLTGTCSETADPDGVFSLSGDTSFSVPQAGPTDTVTVTCDSAGSVANHTGTMSCAHNGSNATPVLYNLSCNITGPAFTSNPVAGSPLTFTATEQNDPDPTKTISVTNTGGTGTLLDVTCTDTVDPDGVFSVTGGAFLDLGTAGPAKVVTVSCDTAGTVATHTGTLSCTHNGTNASPATYALSCQITPPGAAIFDSNPDAGAIIDLTPTPVAQGTDVPAQNLTFYNLAGVGDSNLYMDCLAKTGSPEITQTNVLTTFQIAPGANNSTTFDCNTANVGSYSATFTCNYDLTAPAAIEDTRGTGGTAIYTIDCEVRAPEAVVAPSPASGTPQEAIVSPSGSYTFSFVFNETSDEGEDGAVETCTLADGTNYEIVSPASFPAVVPAGGSLTVQVQGTDPGGVDSFSDTLNCIYSDTAHPYNGDNEPGVAVSWPLTLVVGGDGSFLVTKEFTDGSNPTEVEVTLSCNTGLPIIQSQTISETQDVNFIVTSFDTGELDCSVTENLSDPVLAGYTPTYYADDSVDGLAGSCEFVDVNGGDEHSCRIVNNADPVPIVIVKDWIIDGIGGDQIDQHFELTLYCDAPIVGVERGPAYVECGAAALAGHSPALECLELEGNGDTTFTPEVIPQWPSSHCWVEEEVYDDAAEVENGCGNITVSHGQGAECLITNTVFFEGIPTLSQYGMAIMALLMLGVGLVGFRRFI